MKNIFLTILFIHVLVNVNSQTKITSDAHLASKGVQSSSSLNPGSDSTAFQQSGLHLFSLSSGYARHIERDDAISPFIYRGSTIPLEINYRFLGNKNRYTFSFFFDNLTLNSVLPDYGGTGPQYSTINTNISIKNFYTRKVFSFPKHKLDLFFGGGLHLLLNYRLHSSGFSNSENNYTMLDQFNSLAFMFHAEKKLNTTGQSLTVDLFIPGLSYVLLGDTYNAYVGRAINNLMNSDSNVLIETFKNGDWTSFNDLICINATLSYTRFMRSHFGIELKYGFQYYKFTQYTNLNYSKNLQNSLLIGIICKL